MPDKKGLYSANEAAEYLGMHPATFNRRVAKGEIKPVGTLIKFRRYSKEELDRYKAEWEGKRRNE
jgi:excisionase family DNA binding protein